MIANALPIPRTPMLALALTLMGERKFFVPFKRFTRRAYSADILAFGGVTFANILAAAVSLNRNFFQGHGAGSAPISTNNSAPAKANTTAELRTRPPAITN